MNTATTHLPPAQQADPSPQQAHVVLPTAGLKRMGLLPGEAPSQWVDYTRHPAYQGLAASASLGTRIVALRTFARCFLLIVAKRLISYELIPGHLRNPRGLSGAMRLLSRAMANLVRKVFPRPAPRTAAGDLVAQRLRDDGICVLQVDPAQFARLQDVSQPQYDLLRQRRGAREQGGRDFAESRGAAKRDREGQIFDQVEAILERSGALAGVATYLGHRINLVDVNPQINDRSDDFWRHIFPDLPAEERPARYLHRDASGGDIKAIFYLSDVGPKNGPFSYVLGSHTTRGATLVDWVEESNDQGPLSATGPRSRELFAALPRALQRKCSCGNDVLEGSHLAQRLLEAEWTVTAPRGHVVLFDTKGFHRGGLVEQDERIVMTCVLG